ncbi:MAG TPA: hypothetical protein VE615_04255 [Gaiellaceae bacterium]|nr:hypothetical protein [Gaiellaceae bacterium]
MRASRTLSAPICAICERTLLVGERPIRYAPDGQDFVDVCPLCQEIAVEQGWRKEGSPTTPTVADDRPRKKLSLTSILELRRSAPEETVAPEPILRRLSDPERAMVEASDLFNASPYRRTVGGIAKSLGDPRVSVVPLSGLNTEVVVTIAWEISWYQYRVLPDSAQPVRLAGRGHELGELEPSFTAWNARVERDGRVVPEIARL